MRVGPVAQQCAHVASPGRRAGASALQADALQPQQRRVMDRQKACPQPVALALDHLERGTDFAEAFRFALRGAGAPAPDSAA